MEIKEILQFVKDDIIDIPSALDLLLVYIKDSDKKELLELLNTQIEQYPKESKMVISEIIYTRREKWTST